jgi:hypothetical protein
MLYPVELGVLKFFDSAHYIFLPCAEIHCVVEKIPGYNVNETYSTGQDIVRKGDRH